MSLTDFGIHLTGNQYNHLKICKGARVILSYKIDLEHRLIHGSTGTVAHL